LKVALKTEFRFLGFFQLVKGFRVFDAFVCASGEVGGSMPIRPRDAQSVGLYALSSRKGAGFRL
jgi:hypothetical protein